MLRNSIFLTLIVAILSGLVWPARAYACSCAFDPDISDQQRLDENVGRHEVVFSGTVTAQEGNALDAVFFSTADPVYVTVDVENVWKGQLPPQVTLTTARDSVSCGYEFVTGRSYLIFASDYNGNGQLETGLCANNLPIDEAGPSLELLGVGMAPSGDASGGSGGFGLTAQPLLLPLLVTFAALIGATALIQKRRKRHTVA